MLNNTFSQSTRSQPQGLDRAKHSITTPEKLAPQFYLIAKPEGSPIVYHSITTWPPGSLSTHHAFNQTSWEYGREENQKKLLDHHLMTSTRLLGRWTIPSRLHFRPLDRKVESLKPSLINDIPWRPNSAHQMLMTYSIVGTGREDYYLSSFLICFILIYINRL